MKQHRNVTARQEALSERSLFAVVLTLKTVDECRAFFRDLCTPAELQAIADRWAVVEWLQKGLPYREIHRLTGVSVTTIGRVARCLADGNGGYALAVSPAAASLLIPRAALATRPPVLRNFPSWLPTTKINASNSLYRSPAVSRTLHWTC